MRLANSAGSCLDRYCARYSYAPPYGIWPPSRNALSAPSSLLSEGLGVNSVPGGSGCQSGGASSTVSPRGCDGSTEDCTFQSTPITPATSVSATKVLRKSQPV